LLRFVAVPAVSSRLLHSLLSVTRCVSLAICQSGAVRLARPRGSTLRVGVGVHEGSFVCSAEIGRAAHKKKTVEIACGIFRFREEGLTA
jgi:hypothetical protein